jgi:hypothetical protein
MTSEWIVGNPETEIGLVANFRVARHPPQMHKPSRDTT